MTYYVILLAIISNDIPLSLPITFIYHCVFNNSLIQYTSLSFYCSFEFLLTNILLLGLSFFHSNHSMEPCNWWKPTKPNQPRIVLTLGGHDSSLKYKYCALRTSVTRPRCTARWTQQNMASWCLFDSTTREVGSTNIVLRHSPLEATGKRLDEEKAPFNCFDGSCI